MVVHRAEVPSSLLLPAPSAPSFPFLSAFRAVTQYS